ncbi:hypothetical protein Bpfe_008715 [Biomphalaria pfeifferi]|uniref:Uncharacterized protein n=1 Tax=Biomphalaria pfeifferi TaxID=112525 RepID=A0AAD8BXT9_BIOPF|nr:hypothetical protein Bpfe_008715 [Biomphalaria pfeifferi]
MGSTERDMTVLGFGNGAKYSDNLSTDVRRLFEGRGCGGVGLEVGDETASPVTHGGQTPQHGCSVYSLLSGHGIL